MQKIYIVLFSCLISFNLLAQVPDAVKQNRTGNRAGINNGHLYGKVVDSKTNNYGQQYMVQNNIIYCQNKHLDLV